MSQSAVIGAGRRITVMGGLGFIGSHLCRALLLDGFKVTVFSKLYASYDLVSDIRSDLEIIEADIMQPREVLDAIGASEYVVDLVHTTRPGSSMRDPIYDISSNVSSHVQWLQNLSKTSVRRIIYVSSGGTVYGTPHYNPIDESHPTGPLCSYGITKLAIEKYVSMYSTLASVSSTILRPANVYGPGNRLNVGQGVIGVLADRALKGEPLEVWGDGESRRDYLYIDDMVAAVMKVLSYEGHEGVFNVSHGRGYSVLEVIQTLRELLGELPPVIYVPLRQFDVPVNVLSSDRLRKETGWEPQVELSTGMARVVQWLKEQAN